jgi:integrase
MRTYKTSYKDKGGENHEVAKWWLSLRDHKNIVRRFPGYEDKDATETLGKQIQRLVSCRASSEPIPPELNRWLERTPSKLRTKFAAIGLISPERASGGKPLVEHLNDFQAALTAKSNTPSYVKMTVFRIKQIFDGCKFIVWSDISASKAQRYLAELRIDTKDEKEKIKKGISAQTFNYYLRAINQFCSWMIQDRRASENPLQFLKGLNVRTDRRHDRRALTPDEVRRLLEATQAQPERFGMIGPGRAMLYRLAVETGLRANELKTLKISSIDFNGCAVTVSAAYSKHRREDTLPIRPDTAAQLKEFTKGKLPAALVFDMPKSWLVVDMIKSDLEAAGIPYVDESGLYADFHCLRHTTGTLLAAAGVHPKTAQSIMRHSTIELTMGRYTHTTLGQESQAIESLPDLTLPSQQAQAAIATGTDGKNLAQISSFCIGQHRAEQDKTGHRNSISDNENALSNTPGAIRTRDLRIRNPLLYPTELRAHNF